MFAVDRDVMESYIENRYRTDGFPRYVFCTHLAWLRAVLYSIVVANNTSTAFTAVNSLHLSVNI